MNAQHPNSLVMAYLRRLESIAARMPADRRAELIEEIRMHIEDALNEVGVADDATVRNVLERLGTPEEIVAAAMDQSSDEATSVNRSERVTLVVLSIAFLLPILGWLIGVALVMASDAWSPRDKLVGLLIGPLPFVVILTVLGLTFGVGAFGPIELFILTWSLAGLFSAPYLHWRLQASVTPRFAPM